MDIFTFLSLLGSPVLFAGIYLPNNSGEALIPPDDGSEEIKEDNERRDQEIADANFAASHVDHADSGSSNVPSDEDHEVKGIKGHHGGHHQSPLDVFGNTQIDINAKGG